MRTINRALEPVPRPLSDKPRIEAAEKAYLSGGKITDAIYQAVEVKDALVRLYLSKCYLCECDASINGVIEHFLPHHPERASRAFAWTNLHWACSKCNGRKTKKIFKEFVAGTNIVDRVLLIDPANAASIRVEDMLTFDNELLAIPKSAYQGDSLTIKTAEFLNDILPRSERERYYRCLTDVIIDSNCKAQWDHLIVMNSMDPSSFLDSERPNLIRAMGHADRIYLNFLAESRPFSTSLRCLAENRLRLPINKIMEMGRTYRKHNGLPELY